MPKFDYEGALKEGYSEDEIIDYLGTTRPNFNVKEAMKEGYNLQEISEYVNTTDEPKKERNALEKGGRIAGQYALGRAEGTVPGILYDVATLPLRLPGGQETLGDVFTREILSDVYPTEEEGKATEPRELVKPIDISIRGLASKATGIDLEPEGIAEKAAQWTGFIKDPKKLFELAKSGIGVKELTKAIFPSGKEIMRGLGAGTAMQLAEEGKFGPIGTLAATILGDLIGHTAAGTGKKLVQLATKPKEALAELGAKLTKNEKIDLQKDIIKDFRNDNIQADIGTLTNSDLVKWVQSRLAQSGLTGSALDELKTNVTKQIKDEYKALADSVGESRFATSHEAGEVAKDYMKRIRDDELSEIRKVYQKSSEAVKGDSFVDSKRLAEEIKKVEESLKPGNLKSAEQSAVLNILETVKRDIYDSEGNLLKPKVKNLINDKIALNDIINYEVQGGSKQLLKNIVSELDRAIISHGKDNPSFARNYIQANKQFSEHAKIFRNKRVAQLLGENDPAKLMNKMSTVQGIKDVEKILNKSGIGQEVLSNLKRFKLDQIIADNFVDSTTQQIKLGTFSKLLEKGKNREIIRELVPPQAYKKLNSLQKNAGRLAESAQKFLNSSKSGITIEDAGIVSKALWDLSNLFMGNPWSFVKTGLGLGGARYLTSLMGDPQFLKLVEEMILATEKNNISRMSKLADEMAPYIRTAMASTNQGQGRQKE